MDLDCNKLLGTFEKATELKLCPNRLWAVAKEDLPKVLPSFNLATYLANLRDGLSDYNDHGECTSDYCEYSQLDFTTVQQRHECWDAECGRSRSRFPRYKLDRAARDGSPTVWSLDGSSLLQHRMPYMAVSHVWSDGTGTGAWTDGAVNECLYAFFREIAERFQCEGIWWDTLCIPREKAARNKAIQEIQTNYEDARVTLVHDCFLRNWQWDPKTACFGILMSPWFSRGWTALELAKSRKVKVIFKGSHGPVFKDLDEEILAKEDEPDSPRKNASRIIQHLRDKITSLNDLLSVLSARYTSWPKDMATISALLVGVKPKEQQQETYKSIIKQFRWIAPGHLFHNTFTMSNGFSWCPANLFHIPLDSSPPSLFVSPTGYVIGNWRLSRIRAGLEKNCWWGRTHALIRLELQDALEAPRNHRLLAECGTTLVERALLVRVTRWTNRYQYIGVLYFRQGLNTTTDDWVEKEWIISSYSNHQQEETSISTSNAYDLEVSNVNDSNCISKPERLRSAIWRGDWDTFSCLTEWKLLDVPDEIGRRPLHLAAERGDAQMVRVLLRSGVTSSLQCDQGRTALHSAVWGGSTAVVQLLQSRIDEMTKDKNGNIALHIASQMGVASVARLLINDMTINAVGRGGLTPLHFAAIWGHREVIQLLRHINVNARDSRIGLTPLHCTVENGNKEVVELLIEYGAKVNARHNLVGWTPLHIAAMAGDRLIVNTLLEAGADRTAKDEFGWTPRQFAEINGHTELMDSLPDEGADSISKPGKNWTPLHCKAINNDRGLAKMLIDKDVDTYLTLPKKGRFSPLRFAAENELETATEWLLWEDDHWSKESKRMTLSWAAARGCKGFTQRLLEIGADTEHGRTSGTTPLLMACRHGHEAIVQLLLEANASRETRSRSGKTPLHISAIRGYEAIVRLLLEFGADKFAKSWSLKTPLYYATSRGHAGVVRLLIDAGASMDGRTIDRETPLKVSYRDGHEKIFRLQLGAGEINLSVRHGSRDSGGKVYDFIADGSEDGSEDDSEDSGEDGSEDDSEDDSEDSSEDDSEDGSEDDSVDSGEDSSEDDSEDGW